MAEVAVKDISVNIPLLWKRWNVTSSMCSYFAQSIQATFNTTKTDDLSKVTIRIRFPLLLTPAHAKTNCCLIEKELSLLRRKGEP